MNRDEQREFAQLAIMLGNKRDRMTNPGAIARDVVQIRRLARRVQALAVAACNRELTPRELKAGETAERSLALVVAQYKGVSVECGGDPRGHVVKLHGMPASNSLHGDGIWGVA